MKRILNRKWAVIIGVLSGLLLTALTLWPTAPRSFLWEVISPQGGRAYLLGSIHLASPSLYPLSESITGAFSRAGALVVEINTEDMDPDLIGDFIKARGTASDGRPLLERLTPETRDILNQSGFYTDQLASLTPWLAALAIQMAVLQQNGFEGRYGLDKHFIDLAHQRRLAILELETLEEQMGLLADMSEAEADLFLKAAVLEMAGLPGTISDFIAAWQRGDAPGFARIFFREYDKYPELTPLMDKIIFRRSERMAARLDSLITKERALFVVVGAGHLVGPNNALTGLEARGYTVSQL
ncbi:MAG: TraB/GumN family protein [Candidatus Adiutrix sp.]|jgi:uncharacterized protein YbaP (TraB family)|nr:TraB/GumN family protein [Candidatus Adiutrix sp.]